jgi:hypothetical protein
VGLRTNLICTANSQKGFQVGCRPRPFPAMCLSLPRTRCEEVGRIGSDHRPTGNWKISLATFSGLSLGQSAASTNQ